MVAAAATTAAVIMAAVAAAKQQAIQLGGHQSPLFYVQSVFNPDLPE